MKILLWLTSLLPFFVVNLVLLPLTTGQTIFYRLVISFVSIVFVFALVVLPEFRDKIIQRIKSIYNNPLFLSILAFIIISIISTIFAVNKYNAFWGTVDRAEGLVGLIFFFSVFIYSLLIFERKDWIIFFKLNLLVSLVVASRELIQFLNGVNMPSSFIDNPRFLAGYLIFSIFCAFVVFSEAKIKLLKYISFLVFILSILGIFFTKTRGTLVGLLLGFIFILVYGIVRGREISYLKFNLRKVSVIILSVLLFFSVLFVSTRGNIFWKNIPGLDRIAQISNEDDSTQTRIIAAKIGLQAVNPVNNGLKKFIIGWGPENYSLAYGKYFNPDQFKYEMRWFDRSHNKLIDVFVMTGLLGLLAYLSIYLFFFRSIFKRKDMSILNIGLLFFGMSSLVHLLFVFDHIVTYVPFFLVLAFVVYLDIDSTQEQNNIKDEKFKINVYYLELLFIILSIFLISIFIQNDVKGYLQVKNYLHILDTSNSKYIDENINSVFSPMTLAQSSIRTNFLLTTERYYNPEDPYSIILSDLSIIQADNYIKFNPHDLIFLISAADRYSNKGKKLGNMELLITSENLFRELLTYTPDFPNIVYGLGLNLFRQNRYDESFFYLEKAFNLSPNFFHERAKEVKDIYVFFSSSSYNNKDNKIQASKRLEIINNLK